MLISVFLPSFSVILVIWPVMIAETLSDLNHSPPSCSCSRDIYPLMSKQPIKPKLGSRERGAHTSAYTAQSCLLCFLEVLQKIMSAITAKNCVVTERKVWQNRCNVMGINVFHGKLIGFRCRKRINSSELYYSHAFSLPPPITLKYAFMDSKPPQWISWEVSVL